MLDGPNESLRTRPAQRHTRRDVSLRVSISTIDAEVDRSTGRRFFRSCAETCANLSRGGAFVTTTEPIAPGRRLLLEFELPGGEQVQTIGRVAWSRTRISERPTGVGAHSGIGIEFVGGDAQEWSALERFLEQPRTRRHSRRRQGAQARRPIPPGA